MASSSSSCSTRSSGGHGDPGVVDHLEPLLLHHLGPIVAADGQPGQVATGQDQRTPVGLLGVGVTGHPFGPVEAQVPDEVVEPGLDRQPGAGLVGLLLFAPPVPSGGSGPEGPDGLAGHVDQVEGHVRRPSLLTGGPAPGPVDPGLAQVVLHGGTERGRVAGVEHGAADLAAVVGVGVEHRRLGHPDRIAPTLGGGPASDERGQDPPGVGHREQVSRTTAAELAQGPQRGQIVEHPERSAMGGQHQVVALDHQVVDRHHRQVGLPAAPAGPVVGREVQPGLGSEIQQARDLRVGPDHPDDGVGWQGPLADAGDVGPRRPPVGGPEQVGGVVIELVAGGGQVDGVGVMGRRLDGADEAPLRQIAGGDVDPALAPVGRPVDQAVVGAGPQHPGPVG